MNNSTINQKGYMLLLTMLFIAATVFLVTRITKNTSVYIGYVKTICRKNRAQNLGLCALNIALSQLVSVDQDSKEKKSKSENPADKKDPEKEFLERVGPLINYWQSYRLTQEQDGIDAELKLCICSENGKFNINSVYDFKEKKFLNEKTAGEGAKELSQTFFAQLEKFVGKNLFPDFEKILKKRSYPFNDVTELLENESFQEAFGKNVFRQPIDYQDQDSGGSKRKEIYLTDLFTVWPTEDNKMNPWLFSEGICNLLELETNFDKEIKEQKQNYLQWIKNFKPDVKWKTEWNSILAPRYKKEAQFFPSCFFDILSEKFSAGFFSVLCYGKVGQLDQKLLVILQRDKSKARGVGEFKISRFYWF